VVLRNPVLIQNLHLLQSSLALLGGQGGGLLDCLLDLGSHGILDEHTNGNKETGNENVKEDPVFPSKKKLEFKSFFNMAFLQIKLPSLST
jgi:hypothetical protein